MPMSTDIQARIRAMPPGTPFSVSDFLPQAPWCVVYGAVRQLVRAGVVKRVLRGVYVIPERSERFGEIAVSLDRVAEVIARRRREHLQISGAQAANALGLSTQVPARLVLLTAGPSKTLHVGRRTLTLQHVEASRMTGAGTLAGVLVSALYDLGEYRATHPRVTATLRRRLSGADTTSLASVTPHIPDWMTGIFLQITSA